MFYLCTFHCETSKSKLHSEIQLEKGHAAAAGSGAVCFVLQLAAERVSLLLLLTHSLDNDLARF